MSFDSFLKPSSRWAIAIAFAATAVTSAVVVYHVRPLRSASPPPSQSKETTPPISKVTALGRLEPEAEVIRLSAPLALDGDRVEQLSVKEGDRVQAGQVVAILDSRQRLQDAVLQAQEQLKLAQARLSLVKAGAKVGAINAQEATVERFKAELEGQMRIQKASLANLKAQLQGEKAVQEATIARLQAELENAQTECQRYQMLYQDGAVSTSARDSNCLQGKTIQENLKEAQANLNRIVTTYQQQLGQATANLNRTLATGTRQIKEAQATLDHIAEVRPVDIQVAQAEVNYAIAVLKKAQTNLTQAYIKALITGQILKIHTRAGEKISDAGIVDLAQTDRMVVVAEVYQTDIGKVKPGQAAVITTQAFPGELKGTVSQIGLQVSRQNVFSNQPGENLDRRVVEVKIRLNPKDSRQVAGLTNLQVQAAILLQI